MRTNKKRAPRRSQTNHQSKYITPLQGNSKFKTLTRRFNREDINNAAKYVAESYPSLWDAANQKRKIHLLSEVLEKKEERGYGAWERSKYYASKMGVKL